MVVLHGRFAVRSLIKALKKKSYAAIFLCLFGFPGLYATDHNVVFYRNSGMHQSNIISLSSDYEGRLLLTSSTDLSARLWDAANGELLRSFSLPEKENSALYSAISPSGWLVAIGGAALHVFNAETGNRLFHEPLLQGAIKALAFSHDGSLLAVSNAEGIRIYETTSWKTQKFIPAENSVFAALAFDRIGWLACITSNGIRFYDQLFRLNKSFDFEAPCQPASLAISPDGLAIAAGFFDKNPEVYDSGTLELIARPEIPGKASISGNFPWVAFSADSHFLLAAGGARISVNENDLNQEHNGIFRNDMVIGRWGRKGAGNFRAILGEFSKITALTALPDRSLAYASDKPEIVRTGPAFETIYSKSSQANVFRSANYELLKVSTNADEIVIQYENHPPLVFSLRSTFIGYLNEQPPRTRLRSSTQSTSRIRLDSWDQSDSVYLNSEYITWIEKGDKTYCADIADHGLRFVLGSERYLYCAARDGDLIWKTRLPAAAIYVNISGNARVVVAALKDGSIRWYSMADGALLLSLFTYDAGKFWALCTASGYYAHSPGAENLIGVMVQKSDNNKLLFAVLSNLADTHHKPEIIDQLILDWDEEKAQRRLGISPASLPELLISLSNSKTLPTKTNSL